MKNKDIKNHNYVLIMAGGIGTRLFPRSTENLPKQFQKIVGNKTLIEQTYDRVRKIVKDDHIFISTHSSYLKLLKKMFPGIPGENYIIEPVRRNTGPAMALATAVIYDKDKDAIIITNASDHLVTKEDEYVSRILDGTHVIENNDDFILCVGITPSSPHTGYGYIEKGKKFQGEKYHSIFRVKRFVEKPGTELAKEYFVSGNFLWNAAYFIWQARHFLDEIKHEDPAMFAGINKIIQAKNSNAYERVLNEEFEKFQNIAVDYLVIEKTKNLLVLPADMGWSDVGNWDVVDAINSHLRDENGNYAEGGTVINVNTRNTTVLSHGDKIIATVGMENIIIVTTEEAFVIIPKGRSEDVKKIVEELISKKSLIGKKLPGKARRKA